MNITVGYSDGRYWLEKLEPEHCNYTKGVDIKDELWEEYQKFQEEAFKWHEICRKLDWEECRRNGKIEDLPEHCERVEEYLK